MKQITFITVQADNVVLWGNPAGALWNRSVLKRTKPVVTQGRMCVMRLPFQIRTSKVWKGREYPAPHFYHVTVFSHFSITPPLWLSHRSLHRQSSSPLFLPIPSLPAWPSQCLLPVYSYSVSASDKVQVCFWRLRSSSYWLQGNYSCCVREKEKAVRVCVVTTALTNCTTYANTPHYKCDSYCSVINHGLEWLKSIEGMKAFSFSLNVKGKSWWGQLV